MSDIKMDNWDLYIYHISYIIHIYNSSIWTLSDLFMWKVVQNFTYNITEVSFLTYKTDKNLETNQRNSEVLEKDISILSDNTSREKYGKSIKTFTFSTPF